MPRDEEKKGPEIVLKLDLNTELESLIERGLNSQIVAGAVNLIMQHLTPENVRKFVEELLMKSMKDFSRYEVDRHIKAEAGKMLIEVLKRPEYQDIMRKKVEEGVVSTIVGVDDLVKKELIEAIQEGLQNWARRQR